MRKLTYTIPSDQSGMRVGDILKRMRISSRLLPELKRCGGITLCGKAVTVRETVTEGDTVEVCLFEEAPSENVIPVNIPIDVVYEDEDILAVSKPKDMPIHPSAYNYDNTLGNAVMYYYRDKNFVYRPITRLDRDTTGVVIIAKNKLCASILTDEMKNGNIKKTYLAYLSKTPEKENGIINAPIERCPDSVIKRRVGKDGKEAVTHYEIIKKCADGTCIAKVSPITGRTHQIRVHMAHIGCPLKYDYLYGTEIVGETLYLHCMSVELKHPITGEKLVISCKPVESGELSQKLS